MKETKRDERSIAQFGDGAEISYPRKPIDCSRLGYFDVLEYECWELVKQYAEHLGIEIVTEDEGGISFDVAKDIQELILEWFKGAGVKFRWDPASPVDGEECDGEDKEDKADKEISELSYEDRIAALEKKAALIGAKFTHHFYGKDHMDCFWYDGNDIATIDYKGHVVCFDVTGDISTGVYVGDNVIPLYHKSCNTSFYHDDECRGLVRDDANLAHLTQSSGMSWEANNWISIVVINTSSFKYVNEPEIGSSNNLLEEVENSFDYWINYIDNLTEKKN